MASVDLSDPHVTMAYDALIHNDPLRWFLLAYGNKPNELRLCASGMGDIDELRSHINIDEVHYGIFREPTHNKTLRISLIYIPDSVRGVWRARALVHGKAVYTKFTAHQEFNVSKPEQVTVQALRSVLRLPPRVFTDSSISDFQGSAAPPLFSSVTRKPIPSIDPAPLSISTSRLPSGPTRDPSLPPGSSPILSSPLDSRSVSTSAAVAGHQSSPVGGSPISTFSSLMLTNVVEKVGTDTETVAASSMLPSPDAHSPFTLGRNYPNEENDKQIPQSIQQSSWLAKQDTPLPMPPHSHEDEEGDPQKSNQRSRNSPSRSSSPHIGRIPDSPSIESLPSSPGRPPSPTSSPPASSLPPPSKSRSRSPEQAAENTIEIFPGPSRPLSTSTDNRTPLQSRFSGSSTDTATNTLNLAPTRSKFQGITTADLEEERKLAVLEEERRRRAAERARREREEREEEEAREREFEERKERERKRRLENVKKAEERRAEQKRLQEEDEARRRADKEKKEEEARRMRNKAQKRIEKQVGINLLSGFITLESSSSWKRRYYRLSTEDWLFFKNDEDTANPMHSLELHRVRALREWNEGYEELEAIPHSFAVELHDDAPWLFFADSAEDKEILLGLLNQAAGL